MAKNQNVYTFGTSTDLGENYDVRVFFLKDERNLYAKKWLMKHGRAAVTTKKFNIVGKNLNIRARNFTLEFNELVDRHSDALFDQGTIVFFTTSKVS